MTTKELFIKCQTCGKSANEKNGIKVFHCGKCFCGYYCSVECQKSDWNYHKKYVCSLYDGDNNILLNPWYSNDNITFPESIAIPRNQELLNFAKEGNINQLKKYIESESPICLSTFRDCQGETLLHLTVISGNIEAIKLLINHNAYINSKDWRNNTPFYYACTHPGNNNILKNNEEIRIQIIKYLINQGADTMSLSGFSQLRPFEAADYFGYNKSANCIIDSPLHKSFIEIRKLINVKNNKTKQLNKLVRKYIDLCWRSDTAHWLIQINRNTMGQHFKPHPQIISKYDKKKNINWVEDVFKDCQNRHKKWWNLLILYSNKNI